MTYAFRVHSKHLRRKVSHDTTFGVYQDDADGFFKRAIEF